MGRRLRSISQNPGVLFASGHHRSMVDIRCVVRFESSVLLYCPDKSLRLTLIW